MNAVLTGPPGRGLPFVDEMVRAIHAGLKSETRRVVSPQPPAGYEHAVLDEQLRYMRWESAKSSPWRLRSPYPEPGGTLWARENLRRDGGFVTYSADGRPVQYHDGTRLVTARWPWKNKVLPARYCPKWAWRTPLRVLSNAAHRLGTLTEEQAWNEGLLAVHSREQVHAMGGAVACYRILWDTINADRGYPSSSDPWCWALSFRLFTVEEARELPFWPGRAEVYLKAQGSAVPK